jgi:flagellar biosynthesis/type III secretory pathway protein FliH
MSSIIKLKSRNNVTVKISGSVNSFGEESESEEEYLQRLEEEKQEQIYNAGREDAIKEMQSHLSKELQNKFNEYDNLMNSVNERLIEYKNSFDKIVLDVSFLIAGKIIKKEISEAPIIIDTIKEATSKIIGANSIVLRINPEDKKLIEESNENFLDSKSYSNIKYEIDERIQAGGCFIESEIGNVDARIESQLNQLKAKLNQDILEEA